MKDVLRNGKAKAVAFVLALVASCVAVISPVQTVHANPPNYQLVETFSLPGGGGPLDVLNDGKIITVVGPTVYIESAPGSRSFTSVGTLAGGDFSTYGAAFVRVSKAGNKFAVGNNGGASFTNYQVGVFNVSTLTGSWFNANHYDGEWITNRYLALTAGNISSPSVVTALDTNSPNPASPVNTTIINNIGGASGGITFDLFGNLYTGNGYAYSGPSGTGYIKAFPATDWITPFFGGSPVNFETGGTLIVDLLSAASLGFDSKGDLLVGGADYFGGTDINFAAVVARDKVINALLGGGAVNPSDPTQVLKLDPDSSNANSAYTIQANLIRKEIYLVDLSSSPTVYVYKVY